MGSCGWVGGPGRRHCAGSRGAPVAAGVPVGVAVAPAVRVAVGVGEVRGVPERVAVSLRDGVPVGVAVRVVGVGVEVVRGIAEDFGSTGTVFWYGGPGAGSPAHAKGPGASKLNSVAATTMRPAAAAHPVLAILVLLTRALTRPPHWTFRVETRALRGLVQAGAAAGVVLMPWRSGSSPTRLPWWVAPTPVSRTPAPAPSGCVDPRGERIATA